MLSVLLHAALMSAALAAAPQGHAQPAELETGRRIYEEGVLPGGAPLVGQRAGGVQLRGAQAACTQCHRRSGMGSVEGDFIVPPITGKALAGSGDKLIVTMDPRRGRSWNQAHEPYSEAALYKAIRDGVHVSGREMSTIMPRYKLADAELKALHAYLQELSKGYSAGVTTDTIHFASVITPEVDATRRQAFIDTLTAAFAQKNANTMPGKRHMVSGAEMVLRTEKQWKLHLWELKGAPQEWSAQLTAFQQKQPVFALVSGLGEANWEPVHGFCEQYKVPCWFPSVTAPPERAKNDFFGLYLTSGIKLEAAVLSNALRQAAPAGRVIVVGDGSAPSEWARKDFELANIGINAGMTANKPGNRNESGPIKIVNWSMADFNRDADKITPSDTLILFVGSAQLTDLNSKTIAANRIYALSSLRSFAKVNVTAAWADKVSIIYPYELPAFRGPNLSYFHAWLQQRRLSLVDEAMQSEVYFAVNYLSDTVAEMLDNLYGDYLIERGESMLARWEARKAEDETRERTSLRRVARAAVTQSSQAAAPGGQVDPANMIAQRRAVSVYPRLSLGPGQRFASKGAYVVDLKSLNNMTLNAKPEWIIPE